MTEHSQLLRPSRVYARSEILVRDCPVPREPGAYGWWFRDNLGVPTDGCLVQGGLTLLYVGISPGSPPKAGEAGSRHTIRHRIRNHLRGNAEGSTLRLSLGCLLGLELRRVGNGKRRTFSAQEAKLSEWIESNAFVAWMVEPEPWRLERRLIEALSLPLNLEHNHAHPFHARLATLRAEARRAADRLPVLAK